MKRRKEDRREGGREREREREREKKGLAINDSDMNFLPGCRQH